jgi:hypothetical protein
MKKILPLITILSNLAMGATLTKKVSLNNFSAGQLSPLMNSRVELPHYKKGAKTLQNMLVRAQGPITRRPGTKYIASVKDATDDTRIIPFSDTNDYIIEIGDSYARFYMDSAVVADVNGATNYEIDTPWDANDVFELQYAIAEGTMRIVHGDYEPYKLYRPDDTNDANWTCTSIGSTTGPFLDENKDTDWTLTPDSNIGDVNIVSTDALFDDDHVGGLFQISHVIAGSNINKEFWTNNYPSGTEESGNIKVWKYQYYDVITNTGWQGTFNIQRSYDDGSNWETVYSIGYKHGGAVQYAGREMEKTCLYRMQMVGQYVTGHNFRHYEASCSASFNTRAMTYNGVVEIKTVPDSTNAVGTVKIELASTDATWHWAEGAWSDYRGWPKTVEYHEQRVLYGGTKSSPETIWASIIAEEDSDYDDFTANTESDIEGNLGGPDDIAWVYKIPGMGAIQWLKSGKYLFAGTSKGVMMLGQPGKPITPNFRPIARIQNYNACAFLQPAGASDAVLYVEKGGQKIRELGYTHTRETYIAPDMTVLAEDITGGGIVDLAFQSRPNPVLWCVREDGTLISFTYQRNDGVAAWAEHISTDDDFESVAQIPGTNEDELWALVNRTVNSSSVRYIEQFQAFDWEKVSSPYDQNDCWFVDSGATDCNSLTWLVGETVAVFADGRPIGNYTVSAKGTISASGYTNYTIGLPFTSVYETMPLVISNDSGPVMAEYSDILDLKVKFYKSLGCHIGPDSSNLVDFEFSGDDFATTLDVVTDYMVSPFVWGIERAPTIYFSEADPIPMTIEAVHSNMQVTYD